jgi:hypothetical protein
MMDPSKLVAVTVAAPKQRVVNGRDNLVFVDGWAVPKTELGRAYLDAACEEDRRNGYIPGQEAPQ